MKKAAFGALVLGTLASMTSGIAAAADAKKTAPATRETPAAKAAEEKMVKCYADSCAGKFEYKGKSNSCNQVSDAMEVPASVCDPKKGLKIAPN